MGNEETTKGKEGCQYQIHFFPFMGKKAKGKGREEKIGLRSEKDIAGRKGRKICDGCQWQIHFFPFMGQMAGGEGEGTSEGRKK